MEDKIESAKEPTVTKSVVRYATFNRRLMAATLDLCIIMLLFTPLMGPIQYLVYGHDTLPELLLKLKEQSGGGEIDMGAFWDTIEKTHFFFKLFLINFVSFVLIFFLTILCWFKYDNTPGKWLLGCKIVDAETYKLPTRKQYIIRFFGYVVSMLPIYIGFFAITWDKRKQAWHDKLAGTVVVVAGHDFFWLTRLKEKFNEKYKGYFCKNGTK